MEMLTTPTIEGGEMVMFMEVYLRARRWTWPGDVVMSNDGVGVAQFETEGGTVHPLHWLRWDTTERYGWCVCKARALSMEVGKLWHTRAGAVGMWHAPSRADPRGAGAAVAVKLLGGTATPGPRAAPMYFAFHAHDGARQATFAMVHVTGRREVWSWDPEADVYVWAKTNAMAEMLGKS